MSRPIHHLILGVAQAGPTEMRSQPSMIDLNRAAIVYTSRSARSVLARARRISKAIGTPRQHVALWVATSQRDLASDHVGQAFGVRVDVFRVRSAAAEGPVEPGSDAAWAKGDAPPAQPTGYDRMGEMIALNWDGTPPIRRRK